MQGFRNVPPIQCYRWIARHGQLVARDPKTPELGSEFCRGAATPWHTPGQPYVRRTLGRVDRDLWLSRPWFYDTTRLSRVRHGEG